ncbi:sialate O-acetylesterase [Pontiella sp.]|uniref:sialate O-acetylesterase n=1 Tax=Pontiella sp. TaxID=2837462 RepID=UPI00356587D7
MDMMKNKNTLLHLLVPVALLAAGAQAAPKKPVKVFILAGQSNMHGHGEIAKGEKGNLEWVVENKPAYKHLAGADGQWTVRNDVFVYSTDKNDKTRTGGLTAGFGALPTTIGPELQFGHAVGDFYDNDVLLIKAAWGGKSLAVDFCPPSAAGEAGYAHIPGAPKDTGFYYVQMLARVHDVLADIGTYVPGYEGQGYEIAGFGWHQGWNDRVSKPFNAAYERNMELFIRDVRRDLGTPNLPFVIATTGMRSMQAKDPRGDALIRAQQAMANVPDFNGNVAVVDTAAFWRDAADSPSKQNYHWNRNAESYLLIGQSMADALIALAQQNPSCAVRGAGKVPGLLAPTPPMGWNSWNAFEKEINEDIIRRTADLMVSTGLRDAGYDFLVIDDAWMANVRDEDGKLIADYEKFPRGMKAVGDYIHSKGLKYGIYQCRGHVTCQDLPGSFEHEEADMQSFADWGVDYIKLDSCYARKNGRLSSEDYAIYGAAIEKTGRPMILSISDFGQGAWIWGGKNYSQLWRTSGDIFPRINSVYRCAETSGGSGSSHPGFNGLWQFAGPGHWNDPDMLQVGNLKDPAYDKVHFSLWCVLAAPLMAGNDLRTMTDPTKQILLAPELIAVNQDPRGQQGYKVYNQDEIEIYNKPLSDGTTAVLLLNKGTNTTDVTVQWSQIGLSGEQPVRDLWERKELGTFTGSFTAEQLAQHGHRFVRVGTLGGAPLPGPVPTPPEKYTVMNKGTTRLADLYYVMKEGQAPTFDNGLRVKSESRVMYRLAGNADRFKASISLDAPSPDDAKGTFIVLVEDKFGGREIFKQEKMAKSDAPVEVDIDVSGLDFIMLEFTGKGAFGHWADARVESETAAD